MDCEKNLSTFTKQKIIFPDQKIQLGKMNSKSNMEKNLIHGFVILSSRSIATLTFNVIDFVLLYYDYYYYS